MRKIGYIMVILALLSGIGGFFLRAREVATIFDPQTGLASFGEPVTIALIALSAVVVLLLFGLSFALPRGQATQFAENFDSGPFARIPLIILSIFLIGLSGLETWSLHQDDSLGVFALILLVGAFASGICLLCMALLGPKGKNVAIPATIPVFWLTVWLIYFHVETAASPVRLGYIYGFFALAALLLSFYYIAGYAFRQTRERRLMFCGSAAIYFSGVVAGGSLGLSFIGQIILPVLGAMVLVYLLLLARNLTRPAPQAHPRTVSPDLLGDEADV